MKATREQPEREADGQIPVDTDHAELVDQPEPDEIVGEPQYGLEPEIGSDDERSIKVKSKTTLGRHVSGEDGFKVGKRRKKHLRETKREGEKVFSRNATK